MVDQEEVQGVAENARLNLTEDEAEEFTEDFESILEMFETLDQVDTDDVEPAFHPVEVEPETREDRKEVGLSHDEVFQNTDNVEDNKFKGPSV